jgi:hypothetical protein
MLFNNFDENEVFNQYARIMQEQGNLEKKANYTMSPSLLGDDDYTEIDVTAELQRIAAENSQDGKLYGVVSDDILSSAHPEGSTKIVDAPDGLGEVETLEDEQAKMQAVAEAKVKLASMVLNLATDLDQNGFAAFAKNLDKAVESFLE